MKHFLTIFTCIILLTLSKGRLGEPEESEITPDSKNFDFYVFAAEWAGSVCKSKNCNLKSADNFWNIHGLWPTDGKRGIHDCPGESFDFKSLTTIKDKLALYWSGLYNTNEFFLDHEWKKHGTCSRTGQLEYFSTGLQVAAHLKMYEALAEGGIVPGKTYQCQEVAKALTNKYGVRNFVIESEKGFITQIMLCLDLSLNPKECPHAAICSGKVQYPEYTH